MTPLPPHTIRESLQTKHVHLRVSLDAGLEVVVPPGFDRGQVPDLLRSKSGWIDRALREMDRQQALASLVPANRLPEVIVLPGIGESWTVVRASTPAVRTRVREADGFRLVIAVSADDPAAWRPALRRWLMRRAKQRLAPWLESVAAESGFAAPRVSIRCPRTRWGSYSSRGTLSLNAQLLFLPPELVRYVFLHELCHAVHLDHSERFWRLLRRHVPDAPELRRRLRDGWQLVPGWLQSGPSSARRDADAR